MIHHRQRLTLSVKSRQHQLRIHPRSNQLDRHSTFHRSRLLSQPDCPHASLANQLQQAVTPLNLVTGYVLPDGMRLRSPRARAAGLPHLLKLSVTEEECPQARGMLRILPNQSFGIQPLSKVNSLKAVGQQPIKLGNIRGIFTGHDNLRSLPRT